MSATAVASAHASPAPPPEEYAPPPPVMAPPAGAGFVGLTFLTPAELARYEARTGRRSECAFLRLLTEERAVLVTRGLIQQLVQQGVLVQSLCMFTQVAYDNDTNPNTTFVPRWRLARPADRFAHHDLQALYPADEDDYCSVHHTFVFNPAWAPHGHPGGVRVSMSARDPARYSLCFLSRAQVDAAHQELAQGNAPFVNSHEHAHDAA